MNDIHPKVIIYVYAYLIFVKAAVLVLLFTLILEGNDNKTYEDVDHEESNNDDVDDVVNRHHGSVIMYWPLVLCVGVNGDIQQPVKEGMGSERKISHKKCYLSSAA